MTAADTDTIARDLAAARLEEAGALDPLVVVIRQAPAPRLFGGGDA